MTPTEKRVLALFLIFSVNAYTSPSIYSCATTQDPTADITQVAEYDDARVNAELGVKREGD